MKLKPSNQEKVGRVKWYDMLRRLSVLHFFAELSIFRVSIIRCWFC